MRDAEKPNARCASSDIHAKGCLIKCAMRESPGRGYHNAQNGRREAKKNNRPKGSSDHVDIPARPENVLPRKQRPHRVGGKVSRSPVQSNANESLALLQVHRARPPRGRALDFRGAAPGPATHRGPPARRTVFTSVATHGLHRGRRRVGHITGADKWVATTQHGQFSTLFRRARPLGAFGAQSDRNSARCLAAGKGDGRQLVGHRRKAEGAAGVHFGNAFHLPRAPQRGPHFAAKSLYVAPGTGTSTVPETACPQWSPIGSRTSNDAAGHPPGGLGEILTPNVSPPHHSHPGSGRIRPRPVSHLPAEAPLKGGPDPPRFI